MDITSIEPPITEDFFPNQSVASNLDVWVPSAHGDGGAQVSPPNRPGGFPKCASRGPRNHTPRPIYNSGANLPGYEQLILMGQGATSKNIASGLALGQHHDTGPSAKLRFKC